ncbi:MAG: GatB/YqeY domain-containing protein [Burkholderiales bacterium]|nr:GatB/YqeY domain-containing protein [Burkholderiales bacterium]
MSLKERIVEDMKAAMRSRDAARLSAIRLLLAAIKQKEVDERRDLEDADVVSSIEKMMKQRRDSISQYESASRPDLAEAEKFELSVLQAYMPQQLDASEIEAAVDEAVLSTGASGVADMGKVMAALRAGLAGRADMGAVSALVKTRLSR